MKKNLIFLLIILVNFFLLSVHSNSNETVYDKIDIFGEVLEKIDKEYVH